MTVIYIIKDGQHARTMNVLVRSDKTLWAQSSRTTQSPMISRVACERLGLDPKAVLADAGPTEALLKMGENEGNVLVLTQAEYVEWAKLNELSQREKRNRIIDGLGDLEESQNAYLSAEENYRDAFNAMMEDEYNDGARPPVRPDKALKQRYLELAARYPRAALYKRAEQQYEGAHWADNTGKGAAGKKAMALVLAGSTVAEVEAALAERREWLD